MQQTRSRCLGLRLVVVVARQRVDGAQALLRAGKAAGPAVARQDLQPVVLGAEHVRVRHLRAEPRGSAGGQRGTTEGAQRGTTQARAKQGSNAGQPGLRLAASSASTVQAAADTAPGWEALPAAGPCTN